MEFKYATASILLDGSTFAEMGVVVHGETVSATDGVGVLNELGDNDWEIRTQTSMTNADHSIIILNTVFIRREGS